MEFYYEKVFIIYLLNNSKKHYFIKGDLKLTKKELNQKTS